MENLKELLIQLSFKDNKFSNNMLRSNSNKELRNIIEKKTFFLPINSPHSQRAWHIFNNTYTFPLCIGGNKLRFISFDQGYTIKCNNRSDCSCWNNVRELSSERMKSGGAQKAYKARKTPISEIALKVSKTCEKNNSPRGKMYYDYIQLKELETWIQQLNNDEISIEEVFNEFHWITSDSTIKYFCKKNNKRLKKTRSRVQKKMEIFLSELNITFKENCKTVIPPLELDFFFPEYNLAIEIDGLWTHSEVQGSKNKHYHLNKTNQCKQKEITLLHFTDDEINDKFEIVSSMIKSKLKLSSNKLGARKCKIVENYDKEIISQFFNDNHIQGNVPFTNSFSLLYNNIIVASLSFSKPRFNKNFNYEVLRFAVKKDWSVAGAFSRLISKIKGKIISYASLNYSSGEVYTKTGFNLSHISPPNYWYIDKTFSKRESSLKYQKHKLPNLLETFNPDLTEWENMKINGFDRIWDCGNLVFITNPRPVSCYLS